MGFITVRTETALTPQQNKPSQKVAFTPPKMKDPWNGYSKINHWLLTVNQFQTVFNIHTVLRTRRDLETTLSNASFYR